MSPCGTLNSNPKLGGGTSGRLFPPRCDVPKGSPLLFQYCRTRRFGRATLEGWLGRLCERAWTADEFSDALMQRKRVVNRTWRFMEEHDFLLTPTTGSVAFELGREGPATIDGKAVAGTAWLAFSALGNFTGLPAASVTIGRTREGLPIGLQIMGRHLDDVGVLALSAALEALYPPQLPPCAVGREWPR